MSARTARASLGRMVIGTLVALLGSLALVLVTATDAAAQQTGSPTASTIVTSSPTPPAGAGTPTPAAAAPTVTQPPEPIGPATPTVIDNTSPSVNLVLPTGSGGVTSQPLTIILLITLIGLAPSMLLLMTSFTRITIVLGLTRNALSLPTTPPNPVLIGLALFLTLFIMGPVLKEANDEALQPYLQGQITQQEAYTKGLEPFREFMFSQVRESDLELFTSLAGDERPENADDVPTSTLVPAYVISELRAAFLLGFVIFIPFLVIDIVVSSALMSMGMVMLPPVAISLPFKLLLFVVVDGWQLTVSTLVASFRT